MHLSLEERRTLVAPFAVGCILGILFAYAAFAFASEFSLTSGKPVDYLSTAFEAALLFFVGLAGAVGVLGALPILVHRYRARGRTDA